MIHIISGWTKEGGSTEAFINLTNAFNKYNIKCCFYGKDNYPINRCNFKNITKFQYSKYDIIISHFLKPTKFDCKKHILSCHESEIYPLYKIQNLNVWDKIHFVSKWQRDYHNINYSNFICPNIIDPKLKPINHNFNKKIGGIIGFIDISKQTHISIKKAIEDNCDEIYIFGKIANSNYFNVYVKPLLNDKIKYMGYIENKRIIYDLCSDIYHYSLKETFGLVGAECEITKTNYHSNLHNFKVLSEEEIINKWKKEVIS